MFDFGQRNAFAGGGRGGGGGGGPGSLATAPNSTGGKSIIKYNPTSDEITSGIRAQATLFSWQSPDGQPHYVTVEVGRLANGYGAPQSDASTQPGTGGGGAGTFPAPQVGVPGGPSPFYSYRATAQIIIGTPGAMQDPFYIDIGRGQRFTTLASYVAVTAQAEPPPAGLYSGVATYTPGSLGIYSTLGIGFAPSVAPVLLTQYIDVINPGTANAGVAYTLPIPPRANFLLPVQSGNKADTIRLIFLDAGGRAIVSTNSFVNGTMTNPLPIPEDADAIIVRNEGGVYANYRLIYQLSV